MKRTLLTVAVAIALSIGSFGPAATIAQCTSCGTNMPVFSNTSTQSQYPTFPVSVSQSFNNQAIYSDNVTSATYPTVGYPAANYSSWPVYGSDYNVSRASDANLGSMPINSIGSSYNTTGSIEPVVQSSYGGEVVYGNNVAEGDVASYSSSGGDGVGYGGTYAAAGYPISGGATSNNAISNNAISNNVVGANYPASTYTANPSVSSAQPSYAQPVNVQPVYTQPMSVQPVITQPRSYGNGGSFGAVTSSYGNKYASTSGGSVSPGLAQQKAQQAAQMGLRGHIGGGLGGARFEGVGWSNQSAQRAIESCCYWGTRPTAQIGVTRGQDGFWYACVLYN